MGTALDHLLGLRDDPGRFDLGPADLRPLQLEAANERFETRIDRIPLLANRAAAGSVSKINEAADLVPVLFAHQTYKTYAEPWLVEGQWDRMSRWLSTVSTFDAGGRSFADATGFDDWVKRLEAADRFVASSSGTTGKPAVLDATEADLDFSSHDTVSAICWSAGVEPAQDRLFMGLGPRTDIARNERIREALTEAFQDRDSEAYLFPVPPITTGAIMDMILLRRRITEGTATPADVAEFDRLSADRLAGIEDAIADAVRTLVESRDRKLFLSGMWQSLHPLAAAVRDLGHAGDFNPENAMFTAGGLKGATLPDDFREVVWDTFNVDGQRSAQLYSMQEINSALPRCASGRYHVPPWVIALPLDPLGETLLDAARDGQSEIEARAAFFDLSLDARWGGVISGDRVHLTTEACACGQHSPSIGNDIVRYADLDGGDKLTCAGTIDAYVRGAS